MFKASTCGAEMATESRKKSGSIVPSCAWEETNKEVTSVDFDCVCSSIGAITLLEGEDPSTELVETDVVVVWARW